MNIELIKSDIKDALRTSFLLGTIESGIKAGPMEPMRMLH